MNNTVICFFQSIIDALTANFNLFNASKCEYFASRMKYRHYDECISLAPNHSFFIVEKQNFPEIGHCEKAFVVVHNKDFECFKIRDGISKKSICKTTFTVITERFMVTYLKDEIYNTCEEVLRVSSTIIPIASKTFGSEEALLDELSKNGMIFAKPHGLMAGS